MYALSVMNGITETHTSYNKTLQALLKLLYPYTGRLCKSTHKQLRSNNPKNVRINTTYIFNNFIDLSLLVVKQLSCSSGTVGGGGMKGTAKRLYLIHPSTLKRGEILRTVHFILF